MLGQRSHETAVVRLFVAVVFIRTVRSPVISYSCSKARPVTGLVAPLSFRSVAVRSTTSNRPVSLKGSGGHTAPSFFRSAFRSCCDQKPVCGPTHTMRPFQGLNGVSGAGGG